MWKCLGPKSKSTRNCCLRVLYHVTAVIGTWMIDHYMLRSHSTNFNFNFKFEMFICFCITRHDMASSFYFL